MTTSSIPSYTIFAPGAPTTGPFSFYFQLFQASELRVIKRSSTGVETELAAGTDYSLSAGPWTSGGSVTTVATINAGEKLLLKSDVTTEQGTDLIDGDGLPADPLEQTLDRAFMVLKQFDEQLGRAIVLQETSAIRPALVQDPTADNTVLVHSGGAFSFAALSSITPTGILATAIGQALLTAATAAAARTAISAASLTDLSNSLAALNLGMRNRVINGDFRFDQRSGGAVKNITNATGVCHVDRWFCRTSTAVVGTLTSQRVATGTPGAARYALRLARTAGAYVGGLFAEQIIESADCYDLAGKTVTLSYSVKKGSAYLAGLTVSVLTGTGVDQGHASMVAGWTGAATPVSTNLGASLSTSLQRFSQTFTVGAGVTEMAIQFATGAFSGSGAANDYLHIEDVQLEIASTASNFDRRSHRQELALCQRFYCKSYDLDTAPGTIVNAGNVTLRQSGAAVTTIQALNVPFPVTMRGVPTVTWYSPVNGTANRIYDDDTATDFTVASTNLTGQSRTGYPATTVGPGVNERLRAHFAADAELV